MAYYPIVGTTDVSGITDSLNTTEQTPRNIADVLAEELARIAENILPPNAEDIAYDNTDSGLTATNVQDAIDEVISSQADVIADTMADLTENKTATVTDGVADFETIDGSLVKSLVVEIEPSQSGSGTPSPSNIRPITGWTQEDVTIVGKNRCVFWQSGYIDASGNRVAQSKNGMSQEIYVPSGTSITFSAEVAGSGRGLAVYSGSGLSGLLNRFISWTHTSTNLYEIRYTATQNCYVVIWFNYDNSTDVSETIFEMAKLQIEFATQATSYEPYHGKTYTTPFNQTVYGGTLDVLTGELTIDRAMVQITASDITFNATNNRAMLSLTTASLPRAVDNYSGVNCIADRFEGISNQSGASTGVGVYANNAYIALCGYKTSLADYQTWLTDNPVTVVYEIATPTTLSLTPQKVKSLVGENHIMASTGDVLECKYSMLINGDDLEMLLS